MPGYHSTIASVGNVHKKLNKKNITSNGNGIMNTWYRDRFSKKLHLHSNDSRLGSYEDANELQTLILKPIE